MRLGEYENHKYPVVWRSVPTVRFIWARNYGALRIIVIIIIIEELSVHQCRCRRRVVITNVWGGRGLIFMAIAHA